MDRFDNTLFECKICVDTFVCFRSSFSQEPGVGSGQTRPNGVVVGGSGSRGSVSLVLNGNVRKSSHSSSKPRSGGDAWTTQDGVQVCSH